MTLETLHRHHFAESPPHSIVDLERSIGILRDGLDEVLELDPTVLEQDFAVFGTTADPILLCLLNNMDQRPAAIPAIEKDRIER